MIVDITGILLFPGNSGLDCPGNGTQGECCCDECDYMLCCFGDDHPSCENCNHQECPRAGT